MTKRRITRRRAIVGGSALAGALVLGGAQGGPITAQLSAWEGVRIGEQGWYQQRRSVQVGYFLENSNTDVGLAEVNLELKALSGEGTVLDTTNEYIEWMAPGQRIGVATLIFLAEGQQARNVSIEVKEQSYRPPQGLAVEDVRIAEERSSLVVTGVLRNPYPKALERVPVSAILYDGAGGIIGGAETSLQAVPAGGTAAARITLFDQGIRPARAEMYAHFSIITEFGG